MGIKLRLILENSFFSFFFSGIHNQLRALTKDKLFDLKKAPKITLEHLLA